MTKNTGKKGFTGQPSIRKKTRTKSTPGGESNTISKTTGLTLTTGIMIVIMLGILIAVIPDQQQPMQAQKTARQSLREFQNNVFDAMERGKCVGIEKFVTFTNFTSDLEKMRKEYLSKYSAGLDNPFGSDTVFYPPAALTFSLKNLDCKQAALYTSCLSNYYPNVDCRMYYSTTLTSAHVGLRCEEEIGNMTYYTST